jgi:hypothetical protein
VRAKAIGDCARLLDGMAHAALSLEWLPHKEQVLAMGACRAVPCRASPENDASGRLDCDIHKRFACGCRRRASSTLIRARTNSVHDAGLEDGSIGLVDVRRPGMLLEEQVRLGGGGGRVNAFYRHRHPLNIHVYIYIFTYIFIYTYSGRQGAMVLIAHELRSLRRPPSHTHTHARARANTQTHKHTKHSGPTPRAQVWCVCFPPPALFPPSSSRVGATTAAWLSPQ